MAVLEITAKDWPLVRTTLDGEQTDADIDAYLQGWQAVLDRKQPYVSITEVEEYGTNMEHIRRVAQWTKETKDLSAEFCMGAALVVSSDVFRFVLSAFLLVTPMPNPFKCVKTREEAIEWLKERAQDSGLTLPAVFPA